MKSRLFTFVLLALAVVIIQLPAQQSEIDHKTFENTKAKAEKDNAGAQYDLGVFYQNGEGVIKDSVEAVRWYRKAAIKGFPAAERALAGCYATGDGLLQDISQAIHWFRKASEHGDAQAQDNLAYYFLNGEGVLKDKSAAVKWYRKAAEQNFAKAQYNLGHCYQNGTGVSKDTGEALRWYRKAADQGIAEAQNNLGLCYQTGDSVVKDAIEAAQWYRKAADQREPHAEFGLGVCYENGEGVTKNLLEAFKWYRRAAGQGLAPAQFNLGCFYLNGNGVTKDYVQAYMWFNLSSAQGDESAKHNLSVLERQMTKGQIAEAQKLAHEFIPHTASNRNSSAQNGVVGNSQPYGSGTGFFISDYGYLISNNHVVKGANQVRLVTSAGLISAKVVKVDAANDLALLKAEGRFAPLPLSPSRGVKLGGTVVTVGFPNIGLQGFAPKLAKGEIASLSGAGDDARYFQISVPVQPGNSGGALVDERGNVVGVVSAKLNASAALAASGSLPENVNYAVKSSYLLSFLESVPDVASKLKEPSAKEKKFEDVVKEAEQAAVLVLVY